MPTTVSPPPLRLHPPRPAASSPSRLSQRVALWCIALSLCLLFPAPEAHALFGKTTVVDENEMGREFDKKVRKMLPIVEDPFIHNYVEGVVNRVYETMPPQPFQVTTAVILNDSLNAFAIPGGFVYVFTGLLAQLESEDQLAAVISHELAHVSQRHVIDRMEKMEKVSLASTIGTLAGVFIGATGNADTSKMGQALAIGSQAAGQAAFLSYTQENEREADHVGINYLVAAGYNPAGMPETFELMLKTQFAGRSSTIPSYLSTHPKLSERAGYLHDRIKEMATDVVSRNNSLAQFRKVRSLVRGRLSDPTWAEATIVNMNPTEVSCYDRMALGMVNARMKHREPAEQAFEQALLCGGSDSLVLREAGSYYFKTGNFEKAKGYLQKSLFMNPRDVLTLYFNARLLGEEGHHSEAIRYLQEVLDQIKTDAEVYYYLGRYQGAAGDLFHAHLNLAYSALYGNDTKQYRFHLDKAQTQANTPEKKLELDTLETTRKEQDSE
ncbi:MAG: M48 family metalloprotease [Proteobacteria bacterium]|nr:M48 family metalloprotease [Pseudomonadota bacterium]MBU1611278.1 M48 family metalloprotease [Pseudomonadota bacterium]